MKHYDNKELLFVRREDVENAIGKPVWFKKDGVEYEGMIKNALVNDWQALSLCPKPEIANPFVGILVQLRNGDNTRLNIGDKTIEYIEF